MQKTKNKMERWQLTFRLHKKGIVEDTIAIVAFLILSALVLFAVPLSNNIQKNSKLDKINLQKDFSAGDDALENYIHSADTNGNSRMDFISQAYSSGNYESIRNDMKLYFDLKLGNRQNWRTELSDSSGNFVIGAHGGVLGNAANNYETSHSIIPLHKDKPEYLVLRLFLGK